MNKFKQLILVTVTSLLMVGCKHTPIPETQSFRCDDSSFGSSTSQAKSPSTNLQPNTLNVSVYVDGTPSMLGYVTHPQKIQTNYMKTLNLLESILDRGWTDKSVTGAKVEYYRLGEVSRKIDRDRFLLAKSNQFYDGKSAAFPLLKVSKIETGINPSQDGKLTVIITDLYQKQEDVNKLNTEIFNKYLNNQSGNAVGILAIKSEFNGDVYIEDGTNRKFQYNTHDSLGRPNSKGFRPFYAIFLGNYGVVSDAFTRIKNSGSLPNESKLVIFSPDYLVSDTIYLKSLGNTDTLPDGLDVRESFSSGSLVVETIENKVELLELGKNVDKDVSIPYDIAVKPVDNTLLFNPNSIKTEVTINTADSLEKTWKREAKGSPLEQAVQLNQWKIEGDSNLKFVTTIKPEAIAAPGLYTFAIEAIAQGIQVESWWSEWSTDNNSSNNWKTYNLKTFLDNLQRDTNSLIQKRKVVIGRFCYAIQKN